MSEKTGVKIGIRDFEDVQLDMLEEDKRKRKGQEIEDNFIASLKEKKQRKRKKNITSSL